MQPVLYARVSTEAQEKQQTIESQLAELRRHAQTHGLEIARSASPTLCAVRWGPRTPPPTEDRQPFCAHDAENGVKVR